jgi:hypothetical protein
MHIYQKLQTSYISTLYSSFGLCWHQSPKGEIEREMGLNISYNRFWCLTSITNHVDELVCLVVIYLRCIKFNTNQQRKWVGELYKVWSKDKHWCCQRRTGHCPVPRPTHTTNWPLLGFSQSHSVIIHRNVRCAPNMSGKPTEQRSIAPNGRLLWTVHNAEVRSQSCEVRTHRTVRCRKRRKVFNAQSLQTPMVGWHGTHRTMNNVVSGAPLDCPVCPSTTTARIVVGAINTPNHLHSSHPSFQHFTFNTRAKSYTPRHNQNIKSSSSLKIN